LSIAAAAFEPVSALESADPEQPLIAPTTRRGATSPPVNFEHAFSWKKLLKSPVISSAKRAASG
jgi:hypothetical protein